MMHTVFLHGSLQKYGKKFSLSFRTVREAVLLLGCNFDGFEREFIRGKYRVFAKRKNKSNAIGYELLDFCLGDSPREIHIVPVLEGAKSGGLGKILLGSLIMIGSVVAAPFTGGTSITAGLSAFSFGFGGSVFFGIGASILLSGVSSLFQKTLEPQSMERADEKPSYSLSGPINMAEQGGAVMLIFGEVYCSTLVINAGIEAVRLSS